MVISANEPPQEQILEKISHLEKTKKALVAMRRLDDSLERSTYEFQNETDAAIEFLQTESVQFNSQQGASISESSARVLLFKKDFMYYLQRKLVWNRAKAVFIFSFLEDLIRREMESLKALEKLNVCHNTHTTINKDKFWQSTQIEWQKHVISGKIKMLNRSLRHLKNLIPPIYKHENVWNDCKPINGKLIINIISLATTPSNKDSVMMQVCIDGIENSAIKLKRNHEGRVIVPNTSCFHIHKGKNIEILFFSKKTELLGYVYFRIDWMMTAMDQNHFEKRKFSEKLWLIGDSGGSVDLEIQMISPSSQNIKLIKRELAIKRKTKFRLGHELEAISSSFTRLIQCAYCSKLILQNPMQCSKCHYTCHKGCTSNIWNRCLADTNYSDHENLISCLIEHSQSHCFESTESGKGHCCHCGNVTNSNKDFKCTLCHQYTHKDCEQFVGPFCGLDNETALSLMQSTNIQRNMSIEENSKNSFKIEQFEMLSVVGKGNFGKVMLASYRETGQLVALKILKKSNLMESDDFETLIAEKQVFSTINKRPSPFLLKCYGIFSDANRVYCVLEWVAGGDLMFHIQKSRFSEEQACYISAQVLLALEYLHAHNIVYRDLKLDNILMTLEGRIKLADYGLCKSEMYADSLTSTFCGTPEFIAPEIIKEQSYGRTVDWWAFGVLLFELLWSQAPFMGTDEQDTFHSILNSPIHFPRGASKVQIDLIGALLKRDPNKRLGKDGAESIKKHPFFASINWGSLISIHPPFTPSITCPTDVSNFDEEFTEEPAVLTPIQSMRHSIHRMQEENFNQVHVTFSAL